MASASVSASASAESQFTTAPAASGSAAVEEPAGPVSVRVVRRLASRLDPEEVQASVGEVAQCDFRRLYRGIVGKQARLSVRLGAGAGQGGLSGRLHYDLPGPAIEVAGEVRPDGSFKLEEKGAGVFEGRCAQGTGVLSGTYSLKGKSQPFELRPRHPGEASLFGRKVIEQGFMPNPPICSRVTDKRITTPLETRGPKGETELTICYPRAIKDRLDPPAEFVGMTGVCQASYDAVQVFGLGSEDAEKLANAALSHEGRPWRTPAMVAEVRKCSREAGDAGMSVWGGYDLFFNEREVLSVRLSGGSRQFRSFLFESSALTLDLSSGRSLALGDVVTDEARLAGVARGCLPLYRRVIPGFFGLEPGEDFAEHFGWKSPERPRWVVVPGGLALLAHYGDQVEAALSDSGIVVPFDVLLREGLLRGDSPVRRLWTDVRPAAPGVPACEMIYRAGELVAP